MKEQKKYNPTKISNQFAHTTADYDDGPKTRKNRNKTLNKAINFYVYSKI